MEYKYVLQITWEPKGGNSRVAHIDFEDRGLGWAAFRAAEHFCGNYYPGVWIDKPVEKALYKIPKEEWELSEETLLIEKKIKQDD